MSNPIDYNAVLTDLEAKRGQIDAAIAVIRSLIGAGAAEVAPESNGGRNGEEGGQASPSKVPAPRPSTGFQNDTFFRLNTREAVKKYLSMMKRPQTPRAIASALREGGQVHAVDDKTAYTNVYTVLKRGKDKDFAQTRVGEWGLVEWYSATKGKAEEE